MSLLLDALKRAEDAKRAKAEAAAGMAVERAENAALQASESPKLVDVPDQTADLKADLVVPAASTTPNVGDVVEPPPSFPLLSLEVVDTRGIDPVSLSGLNPAAAQIPLPSATPAVPIGVPPMTLEALLADELEVADRKPSPNPPTSTHAATAAFRAARTRAAPPEPGTRTSEVPALELFTIESHPSDVSAKPAIIVAPPAPPTPTLDSTNRDAIKNVFAVKQATKPSTKAKWALPLIGLLLSGLGVGGWYVWNEMNRFARPSIARTGTSTSAAAAPKNVQPVPPQSAPTPAADPAKERTLTNATETTTDAARTPEADAPLPPLLPPPATQLREARAPTVAKIEPTTAREQIARGIEALPAANANNTGKVKLTPAKAVADPQINPALSAGYAALASGDYPLAKRKYAEAIAANSNSTDAHLGFATAAARSGSAADSALAVRHYQRVIEIDPRNSTANAALIVLAGGTAAQTPSALRFSADQEVALRMLVNQDPTASNAHFLLGNLYAESGRWRDAQQAYFEATTLQPQNADYNYNLAVSLDHLGQGAAAADFYKRALAATTKGQFDAAAVDRRIAALSGKSSAGANAASGNR